MIPLSDNQTILVQLRLEESQLKYEPLQEELLDHLCTAVEEFMEEGFVFQEAMENAFNRFGAGEFEVIEQQTLLSIKNKYFIMKKLPVLTLLVLIFSISVSQAVQNDPPSIAPLRGDFKVTSDYGIRMHPLTKEKKLHRGIDIKAPTGTAILATSGGEIVFAKEDGLNGLKVVIKHDEEYESAYCHMSKIDVKVGQQVEKGDVIGAVGNTGASTAPHLHYEVIKNGEYVDPASFMQP
ncbi:MAG: M23 family peptidase [Bacteroidetes bacterium]|nr:MAG: M23 family peptidase [Bacteroidota bacterium]